VLEEQLSYWKERLADVPVLELPTDHPRPAVQTHRGGHQEYVLPPSLSEGLKDLARREGATLFMVLLGAFQVLLSRYSGQEDVAVGTPIAGRTRAETEGLIGFFVNTLVMRTDLSGDPTFRELLSRVREAALGAYDHQDLPFEKLVEELRPERDLSRVPLSQVMFALENVPWEALTFPGLTFDLLKVESGTVKFDLSLFMFEEAQGLKGRIVYNADLFAEATIEWMLSHFHTLLEEVVADPDQRLSELELLSEAERHQLLFEWNSTATEHPDVCIHTLFEEQAERTPEAVAVVFDAQQLTYRELNRRANQLARHLRTLGVGPEALVGICVERSLEMVVGLLGILKAGGAYVPMDPSYPAARLKSMIDDAAPHVILTQERLVEELPELEAEVVHLDADWPVIAREAEENLDSGPTADDLAYLIYTSGSTGRPKGVMIEHRALSSYVATAIAAYELTSADRVLQFASLSFDASVEEIFPSLASGSTLVLRGDRMVDSMQRFVREVREYAISVLDLPTAFWHELVAAFEREKLTLPPSVRLVIIGGEKALVHRVAQYHAHVGQTAHPARLINTYGPTEATVVATSCELRPEGSRNHATKSEVPIGRPFGRARVYILDRHLNPAPIGVPGELHVGGPVIARGYLKRTELTEERFIPDPFSDAPEARLYKTGDVGRWRSDGNIEFLGRIDDQVKIRGFRVEPDEVEAVLGQHPAVGQAVVVARQDASGDESLVAYTAPIREHAPSVAELRGYLRQKLPEYMVPSAFVVLEALPLTHSGKVDRKALPAPDPLAGRAEDAYAPPRTPVEEQLTEVWEEILSVGRVGIHDNFFELGGHSLLATRVVSRVREVFGVELPLRALFEHPTIAGLALAVTQMKAEAEIDIEQILAQVEQLQGRSTPQESSEG
jgi:aspartate racemase